MEPSKDTVQKLLAAGATADAAEEVRGKARKVFQDTGSSADRDELHRT